MDPFYFQIMLNGLMLGLIYVIIASGFSLIFGVMKVVNFAHGEFYMLGAFALYFLHSKLHINFFLGILLTIVILGISGMILERIFYRKYRDNLFKCFIISIGLSIVLQNSTLFLLGPDERAIDTPFSGIVLNLMGVMASMERVFTIIVSVVIIVTLVLVIKFTKIGLVLRCVSQDHDAAALQGMNVDRVESIAFGIGCALAATAGSLIGPLFSVTAYMGTMPMLKTFAVVMLGGLGSISGAIVGGLFLGFVESICSTFIGSISHMIAFIILFFVLIIKPTGLMGRAE